MLGVGGSALATTGYSDWKNVTEYLSQHKNTSRHRQLETVLKQQLLVNSASYLSPIVFEKIVISMAEKVKQQIFKELREAKLLFN